MRESGAEAVFVHATKSHSVQLDSRSVCEFVARGQNRTCDTGLSEIIAKFHYTDTDFLWRNSVGSVLVRFAAKKSVSVSV